MSRYKPVSCTVLLTIAGYHPIKWINPSYQLGHCEYLNGIYRSFIHFRAAATFVSLDKSLKLSPSIIVRSGRTLSL